MAQINLERLTGLTVFAKAASLGSYTAAARALGVSPSAISKSIQRLEEHLQIRLFHRTTRSLTLTSEGQDVLGRTLRLLQEAEEIEQVAATSRSEPSGVLKVTATLPIGIHIIAPALPRFRQRYPRLAVDLRLDDRYADIVEEGIDVAVRIGELADSRLHARRLARHTVSTFASPDYLERMGTPRHPDELLRHECVNFRYQSTGQLMHWPLSLGERSVEMIPNAAIVLDVGDALVRVLAAGGGIGMCAHYVASEWIAAGRLVPVLSAFSLRHSEITALWPHSRRSSPNVRAFVDFLAELFPPDPPWETVFKRAAAASYPYAC